MTFYKRLVYRGFCPPLHGVDIFSAGKLKRKQYHLFNLPPDPEEVESGELLEVKKSPVSGSIEGGEKVGIL